MDRTLLFLGKNVWVDYKCTFNVHPKHQCNSLSCTDIMCFYNYLLCKYQTLPIVLNSKYSLSIQVNGYSSYALPFTYSVE